MTTAISHPTAAVPAILLVSKSGLADLWILRVSIGEVATARRAIVVSGFFCGLALRTLPFSHKPTLVVARWRSRLRHPDRHALHHFRCHVPNIDLLAQSKTDAHRARSTSSARNRMLRRRVRR